MTSDDAATAAGLLAIVAGPDRLQVFAAIVLGARTSEEIAERSGIDLKRTWQCLTRLAHAGAISRTGDEWNVESLAIRDVARAALPERVPEDHGTADAGAAAVLRWFVKDGRLTSIPAVHHKRLVILDHIVRVFEPGERYSEAQVNVVLRAFHPDTAALRRCLVDEGMLAREAGVYWRSGGTVLLD